MRDVRLAACTVQMRSDERMSPEDKDHDPEPKRPPRDRDDRDDVPETPPTEAPPVPVKDPPVAPEKRGPYVVETTDSHARY